MALALRKKGDQILLDVAVSPGSKSDAVRGDLEGAVKIALKARAREGRANEALVEFLAKRLGVPRRDVSIVRGQSARRKTVAVAGSTRDDVIRGLAVEAS